MAGEARSRKRAVRLTTDAQERLHRALIERWQTDAQSGKLTREKRAGLLGVSIATAERILSGKGVDRPTLTIAFKSVGLDWDDAYCELAVPVESPPPVESIRLPVTPRRSVPWRSAILAIVLVLLAFGAGRYAVSASSEPSNQWEHELTRLYDLGEAAYNQGRYTESERHLSRAIEIARDHYNAGYLAGVLVVAGHLSAARGDLESAKSRYQESITLRRVLNQPQTLPGLFEVLGEVERRRGRYAEAEQNLREALAGFERMGDQNGVAIAYRDLGVLAATQRDDRGAMRWFERCLSLCDGPEKLDLVTDVKGNMALIYARRRDYERARGLLYECMTHWKRKDHARWIARTRIQMAQVELAAGNRHDASLLARAARDAYVQVGDRAGVRECDELL